MLIVAVNEDASVTRLKGSDRPINGIDSRMSVLAGLRSVSYVVPFSEDTPARLIEAISPDVLVKGGDYAINEITEHVLKAVAMIILEFVEGFSTTATIKRIGTDSWYHLVPIKVFDRPTIDPQREFANYPRWYDRCQCRVRVEACGIACTEMSICDGLLIYQYSWRTT